MSWVDDALAYACDNYGDAGRYVDMLTTCKDRFLVVAFIAATEHYLYGQLGIDPNEGKMTKKRIKEIARMVKDTEYDGRF